MTPVARVLEHDYRMSCPVCPQLLFFRPQYSECDLHDLSVVIKYNEANEERSTL